MSYKKGYIGRGKEVHYVKQGWHRGKMWPWWSYWRSLCGREGGIEFTDKPGTCKICLKHRSIRVVTQSNIDNDIIPAELLPLTLTSE